MKPHARSAPTVPASRDSCRLRKAKCCRECAPSEWRSAGSDPWALDRRWCSRLRRASRSRARAWCSWRGCTPVGPEARQSASRSRWVSASARRSRGRRWRPTRARWRRSGLHRRRLASVPGKRTSRRIVLGGRSGARAPTRTSPLALKGGGVRRDFFPILFDSCKRIPGPGRRFTEPFRGACSGRCGHGSCPAYPVTPRPRVSKHRGPWRSRVRDPGSNGAPNNGSDRALPSPRSRRASPGLPHHPRRGARHRRRAANAPDLDLEGRLAAVRVGGRYLVHAPAPSRASSGTPSTSELPRPARRPRSASCPSPAPQPLGSC